MEKRKDKIQMMNQDLEDYVKIVKINILEDVLNNLTYQKEMN